MKITWPTEVTAKVDPLLGEARVRLQDGNLAGAIASVLTAWELLPEPRLGWDCDRQIMTRGLIGFLVEIKDRANAKMDRAYGQRL